jgi:hypothetical protein
VRQGLQAGLLAAAWIAAAHALPSGMEAAHGSLVASRAAADGEVADVTLALASAEAAGVISAARTVGGIVVGCLGLALLGAGVGRLGSRRAPRPLDATLLDTARRLALTLAGFAALLPVGLVESDAPGSHAALVASELALHAVAAGLVAVVLRNAWRLPRTAAETPARVTVDVLFVLLLLGALAAGRVHAGGPVALWVAPALPWGIALGAVAWSGRPPPPPAPGRGPVTGLDALAFSALVTSAVAALAAARLPPALLGALATEPWTAALGDATADSPDPAALLAEADRVLATGAPALLAVGTGLGVAAWVARRIASAWLRT